MEKNAPRDTKITGTEQEMRNLNVTQFVKSVFDKFMPSITLHEMSRSCPLCITSIRYDTSLHEAMTQFNQLRTQESQITHLFNQLGQEIPQTIWSQIKIKENITLYLDQPI